MKLRNGFVSNSSSSSFICEVCGIVESGWDSGLVDFEMCECQNGHTVCQKHLSENILNKSKHLAQTFIDEEGCIDPELCPICKLEVLPDWLLLQYILKDFGMTKETVLSKIRERFSSYKTFNDFIIK